jgi:hypothetical protein
MGNTIDHSGNLHTNDLYIGTSTIVIDSSCNFFGNNANLTTINIGNKKFVDSSRRVIASSITCANVDTSEIKINGKSIIDKHSNLTINSFTSDVVQCNKLLVDSSGTTINGEITCRSLFCDNLYLPVSDDGRFGRIRCTMVNTNNVLIPTGSNCYVANLDFSLVLSGTDGTVTTTKLTSLNGIDTSGNINTFGNNINCGNIDASGFEITCAQVNADKFIFPTIESNIVQGPDVFLPRIDLTPGEAYYDKYDGKLYIYQSTNAGLNSWMTFSPSGVLTASIIIPS